jgi:glyoxylase-like metal-dependent hydrolase (beta-lactamase superfamily II)
MPSAIREFSGRATPCGERRGQANPVDDNQADDMTVPIHTLDLHFQGHPRVIAIYMLLHSTGALLIESGPATALAALEQALAGHGLVLSDVTHVLLTHIHLDHAGAAGWLARKGALIHVHPVGAPHLVNPEKLLASASRIYGDQMEQLWGEVVPVPQEKLVILNDGDTLEIGSLSLTAIDTPGHAEHHHAYLLEDLCFSGDVGGVRIGRQRYLRAPMPPPELNLEKWHASIRRLRELNLNRIAPTHFGIFDDPSWQLTALEQALDEAEKWMWDIFASDPSVDDLRSRFAAWMESGAGAAGLGGDEAIAYALANPLGMSADGLQRYWKKHRNVS